MSLAELCKSTAKKAKEKERFEERKSTLEIEIKDSSEEEIKPKPRIGPHTPPLPREPSSPRLTPEPSSTADFSKSYYQDEDEGRYKRHHHHHRQHRKRYISSSRSTSPIDSYRSHCESRSYSAGSSHSHAKYTAATATSTTLPTCKKRQYREISIERDRHHPVSGTRTVSPPPLSTTRRPPVEKKPYYVDKKRERDRLRQKYGEEYAESVIPKRIRSSPDKLEDKHEKHRLYYHSYGQRSLSRSKSPIPRDIMRTRSNGPEIRHMERYRHLSPMSEHHLLRRYSRSRSRERRMALAQPATQIITIPVAVPPDYPYAVTSWPPQFGSAFPLNTLLPPGSMPPIRSPYGMPPYNPNMFRPQQRYPHVGVYGPRPMRRLPFPPNRKP